MYVILFITIHNMDVQNINNQMKELISNFIVALVSPTIS